MKIKLGKLLSIVSQVVGAIPTIVDAVKPIVHQIKRAPNSGAANDVAAPQQLPDQLSQR